LNYESGRQQYPAGSTYLADDGSQAIGRSILYQILPQIELETESNRLTDLISGADYEGVVAAVNDNNEFPIFLCPSSTQDDRTATDSQFNGSAAHYHGVGGPGQDIGNSPAAQGPNDYFTVPEAVGDQVDRFRIGMEGVFSPFTRVKHVAAIAESLGSDRTEYSAKRAKSSSDVRDGTSNTLMFGEVSRSERTIQNGSGSTTATSHRTSWSVGALDTSLTQAFSPETVYGVNTIVVRLNFEEDLAFEADSLNGSATGRTNSQPFGSNHPGGIQFAYADGHVKQIAPEIEVNLLKQLSSINGGEVASDDGF
jgi:prepilin-type processing-associated H-X9-DG protein